MEKQIKDILKDVQSGKISVEKAEALIKKLATPEVNCVINVQEQPRGCVY